MVDRLHTAGDKVGGDIGRALDAARANDVEELGRELRKQGANASSRDDDGAVAPEMKRQLPHPVEIDLQPGEKDEVVPAALGHIERSVPILMMEADIEIVLIDQRRNVQAADRLHD